MDNQNVTLHIDIQLFGLEPKRIDFEYMRASLDNIDKKTYPYLNEESFFEEEKGNIMKRIASLSTIYDIKILPTDIELGEEKMYIQKGDKRIHPLFQEIKIKNMFIKLEDLVKNRLAKGKLLDLYQYDKKRQTSSGYEPIFEGCSVSIMERIEMNVWNLEDLEYILRFLKSKSRVYLIFRWILLNAPQEELEERFYNEIPLEEIRYKREEKELKREIYRCPYKDN